MKKLLKLLVPFCALLIFLSASTIVSADSEEAKCKVTIYGYRGTGITQVIMINRDGNRTNASIEKRFSAQPFGWFEVDLAPGDYTYEAHVADSDKVKTGNVTIGSEEKEKAIYLAYYKFEFANQNSGGGDIGGFIDMEAPDFSIVEPVKTVDASDGGYKEIAYVLEVILNEQGTSRPYSYSTSFQNQKAGIVYVSYKNGVSENTVTPPILNTAMNYTTTFTVAEDAAKKITMHISKDANMKIYRHRNKAYTVMDEINFTLKESTAEYDTYELELTPNVYFDVIAGGGETKYKKTALTAASVNEDKEFTIDLEEKDAPSEYKSLSNNNDIYTNIGNGGFVSMNNGESIDIEAFRVPQTTAGDTTNQFVEPDMHYEVISGNDVIELKEGDESGVGRFYKTVTAKQAGTAVIKVTYDEMNTSNVSLNSIYGADFQNFNCSAIDPANAGIIIIKVGTDSEDIESGIDLSDYDTVYFTGKTTMPDGSVINGTDTGEYTFKPTAAGGEISVSVHDPVLADGNWEETWEDYQPDAEGNYTIKLKEGRNIVKITATDKVLYKTINAKSVNVTVANNTRPGKMPQVGDEIGVSFQGLELPIYKMAAIYNPGYPSNTWVQYKLDGDTVRSLGVQYSIDVNNTVTFTANKGGENVLNQGKIHCEHMGSSLDTHLNIPLSGLEANKNASSGGNTPEFCILPNITIQVANLEDEVIALINRIDEDDYLGTIKAIIDAQAAYDALDKGTQEKVTNYNILKAAYTEVRHVIEVIKAIENLPDEAVLANKNTIYAVETKYKALSSKERAVVYNSRKLEQLVASLEDQEEREQRIAHVTDLIDRLPNVDNVTADISIQNAIVEAQAAYNALSADEQREIKNINKLVQLQKLLPNLKAAQIVVDVIGAIGDVTEENYSTKKDAILKARSAYEALTAEQKKYVTNYDALDQAEYNYALFQVDEEVRDVMAAIRELYETTDSKGNKIPGPLAQTETNGSATWEIWISWKDYVVNTRGLVNALAQEKLTDIGNLSDLELAESYISTLEVSDVAKLLEALPDASTIAEYIAAEPVTTEVTQIGGEEMAEVADAGIYEDAEEITDVETYEESEENVSAAQKRQLTAAELKAIATAMNAYKNLSEKQQKLLMADRVANLIALDTIACTYAAYNEEYLQMYVDELEDYYLRYRGKELYQSETSAIQAVVDKYDTYPAESQAVLNTMKAAKDTGFAFAAMRTVLIEQLKQVEKDIEAAENLSEWILSLPTNVTAANLDTLEKDITSIEQEYEKLSEPAKTYVRNLEHLKSLKTVAAALRKEIDAFGAIQPTASAKVNSYSSVTVSWKEVADANSYYVYRKSGSGGWKRIASVGTLSYIDQTVSGGTTYYYTVRAVSNKWGGSAISGYNRTGAKAVTPFGGAVSLKSVKAAGYNSVKLTWDKVNGAAGYRIYRAASKNGTYTKIKTISSRNTTAYTDTKLTTGKTYYYKMRAYRMTGSKYIWASYSSVKSAKPVPATVNLTTVTARSKSAVLKWNKVSGASGYVVYRATSKNGKYTRVASVKSNKFTYTNTKLKSKKAYYYKVRAYRTVKGKNVYGSASTAKGVKAK